MGSVFRVPVLRADTPELLLTLLSQQQICSYASVPAESAVSLTKCHLGHGCAVWIGNEGNGLSRVIIELSDKKIKIPMKGETESLNAAVSASILMYRYATTKGE